MPSRVIAADAPVDSAAARSDPQLAAMAETLRELGWRTKTDYLIVKGTMGEEKVGTKHAEVVAALYETPEKALHEFEETFPPCWETNGRKVDVKVCPGRKVEMFSRADGYSSPDGHGYGQGVAIAEIVSGRFEIRMNAASIATAPLPQVRPDAASRRRREARGRGRGPSDPIAREGLRGLTVTRDVASQTPAPRALGVASTSHALTIEVPRHAGI